MRSISLFDYRAGSNQSVNDRGDFELPHAHTTIRTRGTNSTDCCIESFHSTPMQLSCTHICVRLTIRITNNVVFYYSWTLFVLGSEHHIPTYVLQSLDVCTSAIGFSVARLLLAFFVLKTRQEAPHSTLCMFYTYIPKILANVWINSIRYSHVRTLSAFSFLKEKV